MLPSGPVRRTLGRVGENEPGEEELLPQSRPWPRWLRVALGLAVATVLAVAVQQAVSRNGDSVDRSLRPPAVRPLPSTAHTALPDGPAPTGPTRGCPHHVVCSNLRTQPISLVMAVRQNLPATSIQRVRSIVYVSPAEHRSAVWYRRLVLRSGSARIAVEIRQPARGDRNNEESYRIGAQQAIRLQRVYFDHTVSITMTGLASSLILDQLRGLARDTRLVAA